MDLTKIKENEILKIKDKNYQVVNIENEAECLPPEYKCRNILEFDLVEIGKGKLTPSHRLIYYLDTKEIVFYNDTIKKITKLNASDIGIISL